VIKEVKPVKPVDASKEGKDGETKGEEVDEAVPQAKIAAGGK